MKNKIIVAILTISTFGLFSCSSKENSNPLLVGAMIDSGNCVLPLWAEFRVRLETTSEEKTMQTIRLDYGHMEWLDNYNEKDSKDDKQKVNLSLVRKIYSNESESKTKLISLDLELLEVMSDEYSFHINHSKEDFGAIVFNQEPFFDKIDSSTLSEISQNGRIAYGLVLSSVNGEKLSFLENVGDYVRSYIGGYYTVSIGYNVNAEGEISFSNAEETFNEIW